MPATTTLNTATLVKVASKDDGVVTLDSTSNVRAGYRLFCENELMEVIRLGVGSGEVVVRRGTGGTASAFHSSGSTVYIGTGGHQFYYSDPVGRPHTNIEVSPYINVINGRIWFAQGDVTPVGQATRWWQQQTATYDQGPLGVRTVTYSPTSST